MSRYVRVTLARANAGELIGALESMGLTVEAGRAAVMLRGSLECAGEPVDVCVRAGALGTVEDFGFVFETERLRLVCGELDQELLEHELVPEVQRIVSEARVRAAAEREGMSVDRVVTQTDGSRRLVLRRK